MIQSIIFNKKKWSPASAFLWLSMNRYKAKKIDETDKYYRFRQEDPKVGSKFFTMNAKDRSGKEYKSIKFIISY